MNNEVENSGSLKRKELGKERVSVPMVQWSKCHNTIQYGHNGYNTIQNGHNGGNAAIVTAVLGSVKMLSRPPLITRFVYLYLCICVFAYLRICVFAYGAGIG